jgi:phytoene dehydrogenase-like protein
VKIPLLIIGGGLSGLAAAIRFARFAPGVLILEKHSRIGGLNSYYYRNNRLYETGLHAITNYAEPGDKRAPLNRLLRQLKISRDRLFFHQQMKSEICFQGSESLLFSNDFNLLQDEIGEKFPRSANGFRRLITFLSDFDPFIIAPFRSAKSFLKTLLPDRLLIDMLLCPLMYYGSSIEDDMDLSQFAIMFRAIFLEGMFRPGGTIKNFLDLLSSHYYSLGGTLRTGAEVQAILHSNNSVHGVTLASGETIECEYLLSTIGSAETLTLLQEPQAAEQSPRLAFVESIFQLPGVQRSALPRDRTIIFYNCADRFHYRSPKELVDYSTGVICLPFNFQGLPEQEYIEVRSTHLASYSGWKALAGDREGYALQKTETAEKSKTVLESIIGAFSQDIVFQDTFTPLTIERYTAKKEGAIYGSPLKTKDGNIGYTNLFLAGTDQGFLGIVGSMLSGVSMVNQHILSRF